MELWTAFTLGVFGSLHCIGMCGPIAMAIPIKDSSWGTRVSSSLFYNLGRITTYSLLGFVFGLFGKALVIAGFQKWFALTIGTLIIIYASLGITGFRFKGNSNLTNIFGYNFFRKAFAKLITNKSLGGLFILGLLNGLLPCGLVYLAIAGAIGASNGLYGALYMALFGLGTAPIMLSMPVIGNLLSTNFRSYLQKFVPAFIIMFGLVFLLRGANLGIPYLSPKIDTTEKQMVSCCATKKACENSTKIK